MAGKRQILSNFDNEDKTYNKYMEPKIDNIIDALI